MSHYEERLEQDLEAIRQHVHDLGEHVEASLKDAVQALLEHDWDAANDVILGDMATNRSSRALDHACHAFVVRHSPSAGHLRFVSSVLRINVALERMGDYAVTVGRETIQLSGPLPDSVKSDIELIAHQSWSMLDQALHAFMTEDVELARKTMGQTTQVEMTFQKVYADLLAEGEGGGHSFKDLFALLGVIASIGRVSDHAKNIGEETVFTATGETKQAKVFRILFVDEKNEIASQLAEAYARDAYPDSGRYESAGWNPSEALSASAISFLESKAVDVEGLEPSGFETMRARIADYHIVVALDDGVRSRIPEVPYRTLILQWNLPAVDALTDGSNEAAFEAAYAELTDHVRGLMDNLQGTDGD